MSSVTKNWTKEDFRKELRRLDEHVRRTQGIDLVGAELDIEVSLNSTRTLGLYFSKEKKFRFSLPFFNSDIPEACAIDVIRHEYAHYYAEVVFGAYGHGTQFKKACNIVGANPNTHYSRKFEDAARRREAWDAARYDSTVRLGHKVLHPSFGEGTILSLKNSKFSALLTIDFGQNGVRIVDEKWLRENGVIE